MNLKAARLIAPLQLDAVYRQLNAPAVRGFAANSMAAPRTVSIGLHPRSRRLTALPACFLAQPSRSLVCSAWEGSTWSLL